MDLISIPPTHLIIAREHILTTTMVGTRKTPGFPIAEAVDDDDDTIDTIDQLSVGSLPFQVFLYVDF